MARAKFKPSLLTRAIGTFAPVWGLQRLKAETQFAIAGQWAGGALDRNQTVNWTPFAGSPDADMQIDRKWLRTRSRDLQRNNPLARGAINTNVTSAVGTGLALRVRINAEELGLDKQVARDWQLNTEREFRLWAENPRMCDVESTLTFAGLQSLAFRSALESGDVFAPLPMIARNGLPYDLKVQLVEADRVVNKENVPDNDTLYGGVERDKYGGPVAYHIMRKHPGGNNFFSGGNEWDVVPAFGTKTGRRNVLHLFDKLRPGQGRGVPYLSPVIETLKQIGDYTDGELRAALVSSLFTVFVKSDNGQGFDAGADGTANTGAPSGTGDVSQLASGAIVDLGPNESIETANPGRPNTAFDGFVLSLLRQVGGALELPFEVLVKHFNSSYSASRASLLEAWRYFKGRRAWLAAMFCQPIYEAFLDEAVANGRIAAPGYFTDAAIRAAYLRTNWVGDSQGQIDPMKEASAAKQRLALLLTTFSDETAALTGEDWEDIVARRQFEENLIDENGLRPVLLGPGQDDTMTDPNQKPAPAPKTPAAPAKGP